MHFQLNTWMTFAILVHLTLSRASSKVKVRCQSSLLQEKEEASNFWMVDRGTARAENK